MTDLAAIVAEMLVRANELRGTDDAAELRDWAMRLAALHSQAQEREGWVLVPKSVLAKISAAERAESRIAAEFLVLEALDLYRAAAPTGGSET